VSAADQKRADDAADAARQARHSAIIADVKTKAAGALGEAAKQLRAHPDAAIDKRDLQARLDAANKADINAGPDVETLTRALAPPAPFKGVNLDEKAAFDALNARALMALQPAKLREMFDELEEVGAIAPNNEK
jgi:hypothetical protein